MQTKKRLTENELFAVMGKFDEARVNGLLAKNGITDRRTQWITNALVENTKQMMKEDPQAFVGHGSTALHSPIILPLVTRMVPQLFSTQLVGVVPMSANTGEQYALRYHLQGSLDTDIGGTNSKIVDQGTSLIVVMDSEGDDGTDDLVNSVYTIATDDGSSGTTASEGVKVLKVHLEGNRVLFKITDFASTTLAALKADINDSVTDVEITQGGTTYAFTLGLNNDDIAYTYFKNYTGPQSETYWEDNVVKRNRMGFKTVSQTVTAKARELTAEFSKYARQDMLSSHGFDIEDDILTNGAYLLARETDGEILAEIEAKAILNGTYTIQVDTQMSHHVSEMTKLQTIWIELLNQAKMINKSNRKGEANWIVGGSTFSTFIQAMPNFKPAAQVSPTGEGFIGTLGGKFNIFNDNQRDALSALIGYKGMTERDNGIIFCPYRPIEVESAIGENDFRRKKLLSSRYGIATDLYGAENYYRKLVLADIGFMATKS